MSAQRAPRIVKFTRLVCLAGLLGSIAVAAGSRVSSQGGQSIGGYQLVSEEMLKGQTIRFTYRAVLSNTGAALSTATATITANYPGVKLVDRTLTFGPVAQGGTVLSSDTFALERKANSRFDLSALTWSLTTTANRPPIANAGPDLTRQIGETAQLDGSASTDPDGNPLTYFWSFVSLPNGSGATLSSPAAVKPTFLVDLPGRYVVQLVVHDGFVDSTVDTVTVNTLNVPPVADAGPDQTTLVQQQVTLNGSESSDVDGDALAFSWSFASRPPGSTAVLTNPTSVTPTFVVDRSGTYVVELIVNDGMVGSAPDTVTITTQNSPPVANAGPDQSVFVTTQVMLDGSGSTDVDGDELTYFWALTTVPPLSAAALSDAGAIKPTFIVDRPGTYVAQLIVDDGTASSAADTVTITTENSAPVANAGLDQSALAGASILLDGNASSDADHDSLTFRWSFTTRPEGSAAILDGADLPNAFFVVDRPGTFVVQLIVNDGHVDSVPDTVTVTTTNTAPVANAGPDQSSVLVGTEVILDATQSNDPDAGQRLTYWWSLLSRPPTSNTALDDPASITPRFVPDVEGDYVAQLIVSDGYVDSAPDTVFVHAHTSPVADAGPDQQVTVGATVRLDGGGSRDPDGLALAYLWQLVATPLGSVTSLQDPATVTPSFVADLTGDYVVQLTVTDAEGATATDSVLVSVSSEPTSAPAITTQPIDQSVAAGQSVTFVASATGSPAPAVQWQVSSDSGATFTDLAAATAPVLVFVAEPNDDGNRYRAVFTNTAGSAMTTAAALTVTLTGVNEQVTIIDDVFVNGAPSLAALVGQTVDPLALVQFTAVAVDPGDTLTFSLEGAPAGATIHPHSGAFSWTPTVAQAPGVYPFLVRVTDSGGLSAAQSITITVRPFVYAVDESIRLDETVMINGAPMLAPLADLTVAPLTLVQFTAVATDQGDAVAFTLEGAPAGATIHADTGGFSWTPTQAQAPGVYPFVVRVTDSGGLSATQTVTITVRPFVHVIEELITLTDAAEAVPIAVVTLSALDPTSAETGSEPGIIRLSRTGDTGLDLVVGFTIGGTATNGDDYQTLNSTATIPSGHVSVDLIVTPIDDSLIEGLETVVFIINAGTGYEPGVASTATVVIVDNELIVTNVNDSGPGTLRQAILDANAHAGTDTIVFDIPGDPPHSITPITPLPTITDAVILDGMTQPGAGIRQPVIEIDGSLAGPSADGVVVTAGNTTIRGLVINRFGTGGSGEGGAGIVLQGGGNNVIQGNFIGTDLSGSMARPNRGTGLLISGSSANVIGDAAAQQQTNTIAFNGGPGISILSGVGNALYANAVFSNTGLGIDLAGDGVTTNDPGDTDTGPNNFQNFPTLTSALSSNGTTNVRGTFHGDALTPIAIQFFANASCHVSGYGDGTTFLGARLISTDAAGDLTFDEALPLAVETGHFVTAIATHLDGSTSEYSACVQVNPFVTLAPDPLSLLTRDVGTLTVSLSHPAGADGVLLDLSSSDAFTAAVVPSLSVPAGATSATFEVTTGITAGEATITAAAAGFSSGTSQVGVRLRTMTLSAPSPLVAVGQSFDASINFDQPAPPGGITIALASSDASLVTVSPLAVTIAEGDQTASFTVAGIAGGSATISASADGLATATLFITSTTSSLISLGSSVVVAPGQNVGLPLSLGVPAPAGGVTVSLLSTDTSIATVTSSVFVPEGLQIPAANPIVHGVTIGSAHIVASAPGLAPDTASVSVTVSTVLSPSQLNVIQGLTSHATLTLSSPAPAGGLTFNASIEDSALATVPATIHVDAGSTSALVPVTALVVGDTTLRVSAPAIAEATTAIKVTAAPVITVGNATIGKDLQVAMSGTLGAAAPAGNLQVTVTSLEPNKILLAASPTAVGASSVVLTVGAGSSSIPTFYLQALTANGTGTIETSATGYATDTSTITFRPAGFLITTGSITATTFSANTTLQVVSQYLNPTGSSPPTYVASGVVQAVRAGFSVTVPITSSDTNVGRIVSSSTSSPIDHIIFDGGDSLATAAFDPVGAGTTFIRLEQPAGFEAATTGQQISATVNTAPAIHLGDATVGKDLQASLSGSLAVPAPAGNIELTVTSLDPSKVLLSNTPTPAPNQPAGSASITLFVGAGSASIPAFYVQALSDSGTAVLQTTAPNYATDTSTITFRPSGVLLATGNISTTVFSSNSTVQLVSQYLNPTGSNPPAYTASGVVQAIRAGLSVDVAITSSAPNVGRVLSITDAMPIDHVTFSGGQSVRAAAFDPLSGGQTTISIGTPAGFVAATTGQQITAAVSAPAINISNATIGKDLQAVMSGSLGAPVPAGSSLTVTITSLAPGKVLLSTTPTALPNQPAGVESITLTVSAGSSTLPTFYAQALTDTGTAVLEAEAAGYSADTSTITFRPSGVLLGTGNITTNTFAGNTGLSLSAQYLNPAATNPPTFVASGIVQALRAGLSIDVALTSSDTNVGKIVTSVSNSTEIDHVTFDGGTSTRTAAFDPITGGATTIRLTMPPGFMAATTGQQITAMVSAPTINIGNVTVGRDLQTTLSISLAAAPPSPVEVTVTVNNSSVATITKNGAVEGTSTVTFTDVNSVSVGSIVVQGRSIGATTITVRAAGYSDGTSQVTVNPSGFVIQTSSFSTSTFGPNRSVTVAAAPLNPTTLVAGTPQSVRGGVAVAVTIGTAEPSVGVMVSNDATATPVDELSFSAGDSTKTVAFDPAGTVGSTSISIGTPSGFHTPSNGQVITATVMTPDIAVTSSVAVGRDLQQLVNMSLAVAPPDGVTITVTSNDDAIARLTTVANKSSAGVTSLTFNNVATTASLSFYVQGLALGSTTLTVRALGYDDASSVITVNPSGFYIVSPGGNFTTAASAANTTVTVGGAMLNPVTLNVAAGQELRGGLSPVTVPIESTTPGVGMIIGSLIFNGAEATKSVAFDPIAAGTTTIRITTPGEFTVPSNRQSTVATVNP